MGTFTWRFWEFGSVVVEIVMGRTAGLAGVAVSLLFVSLPGGGAGGAF